ncbi:MAG TPA: TIM-barrel domain-containing protein, partial [Polyangiaceae bacterium]|nr:TIM-barrel domain-containing protein [Polyangiaceae bacterium]
MAGRLLERGRRVSLWETVFAVTATILFLVGCGTGTPATQTDAAPAVGDSATSGATDGASNAATDSASRGAADARGGGTAGSSADAQPPPDASKQPITDAGAQATSGDAGGDAGSASDGGDGPVLTVAGGLLKIQVCTEDIIRVAYAQAPAFFARSTLATAPKRCPGAAFQTTTSAAQTTIKTSKLTVQVDMTTGAVIFLDSTGQTVLAEKAGGGRTITAATVQGESTSNVRQEWTPNANESLYGLGQHQQGLIDIKGNDLDLHQYNTEVFIPMLVSSNGYGIFWDNTSYTRFGDLSDAVPLPGTTGLYADAGAPGALPGDVAPGTGTVSYSGTVVPPATGDYTFRTYSSGNIQLSVNGQQLINHWRQGWVPSEDIAHAQLTAGQAVPIQLTWASDIGVNIIRLLWKPPVANRTTSLWSQVGDGVDYWFVYGPELDHVVAGYRRLTGDAPMMPRWAFGFWQSKEHYQTSQEVIDALTGYRSRSAPIDNIVQDWQYWLANQWGSHQFDPSRYPNPATWISTIHSTYHAQLMVSVWPKFYTGTANFTALNAMGFLYQPNLTEMKKDFLGYNFTFYDAFNPAGRQLYWSQIKQALFSLNTDAFWLDATEPEVVEGPFVSPMSQITTNQTHMNPTASGSGSRMLNAFSLVNSQAVYEGQRAAAPNQRVFILTRSGFAGQQRYAAATWSGDITSTWTAMRKQIPAGLSFSLSGLPYWTLDSGGFAVPARFSATTPTAADLAEWYELNTRWFEYASFLPILRVHGQAPTREMWQFGGDTGAAYAAMLKFDRLRYHLLPYIYSMAGMVTQQAGTILRPLVMDFRTDATSRETADEFMFGPAFLVAPVTTYMARTRSVYLPPAAAWYDFWAGAQSAGGTTVTANAAFDAIPVYVRAGSIVPVGPELQYVAEKPADPITLYVYAGADGTFTLYEDQGTTYDYENGAFATIPLTWVDATKTLTIGAQTGSFAGMLTQRTFQVVLVGPNKPVGFSFTPTADKSVT